MKIIISESQYKNLMENSLDEMMMSAHAFTRVYERFLDPKRRFLIVTVGESRKGDYYFEDVGKIFKTDEMIDEFKKRINYILRRNISVEKEVGIIIYKFNFKISDILWNKGWNPSKLNNIINLSRNQAKIYLSDKRKEELDDEKRTVGDCLFAVVNNNNIETIYFARSKELDGSKEIIKNPYDIDTISTNVDDGQNKIKELSENLILSDYLIKGIDI